MNRPTAVAISLLLIAMVSAAFAQQSTRKEKPMLKAVVHVNFGEVERQTNGLNNIENVLKDVLDVELEVVCHGEGIWLVKKQKSPSPELIATLIKQGVNFVACENTLKKKSLSESDLMDGVTTVASGAVTVIERQNDGYNYFKP